MNRKVAYVISLLLMAVEGFAQDDLVKAFTSFSESSKQQYADFYQNANQKFADALRDNWTVFHIQEARVRTPKKPVPDTLTPTTPQGDGQIDISDVPVKNSRSKVQLPYSTDILQVYGHQDSKLSHKVSFLFYGRKVSFDIPDSYSAICLEGTSEREVSRFWRNLADTDVKSLTSAINASRRELKLNDWALFEWTRALSEVSFKGNAATVFTVFCMNQLGLRCKVARSGETLIPLFACEQEVYGRKYVTIGGEKYYMADNNLNISQLNTYSIEMDGVNATLDLSLSTHPVIGSQQDSLCRRESSVLGRTISVPVSTDVISFYGDYPQMDVNMYAAVEPDKAFADAIIQSVKPRISGCSGVEAVNRLLSFVQKDFKYRTDAEQFGREKPFFCEENFVYPYNDCEDRAVLFTFLVRRLLGYDCMLLEYSDHINCAVNLGCEAVGYYVRRGNSRYYICDPTCMGATVGTTSSAYHIKPQSIWVL